VAINFLFIFVFFHVCGKDQKYTKIVLYSFFWRAQFYLVIADVSFSVRRRSQNSRRRLEYPKIFWQIKRREFRNKDFPDYSAVADSKTLSTGRFAAAKPSKRRIKSGGGRQ